jgi:SNF2 family DNA or RNA helicase
MSPEPLYDISVADNHNFVANGVVVHNCYFVQSWILGWNNPLFPYTFHGGSKRFLDCYGTYKFVTKEFSDTLHTGKAQLLPEVSSLNLFARMMAPFMVRRVDGEMAVLPPKHRHIHRVPMTRAHGELYDAWEQWATDRIRGELARNQGADVNMGVISQSLWAMRFAASVPTAADHLAYPDGPNRVLTAGSSWSKLDTILTLVREIIAKGEKVIVTSPLRPMVKEIALRLRAEGIPFTSILASTNVDARHTITQQFNHDATPVLLASMGAICRGLNITGANHIIVAAVEWSPEPLTQVCGRIHRPGQTREVHEHIVLSAGTIDDDMMELCNAKYTALKQAIDAEQRYSSVAEILERATNAAQLEVARKVASRPRVERQIIDVTPIPEPVPMLPVVVPPPIPTTASQINLF